MNVSALVRVDIIISIRKVAISKYICLVCGDTPRPRPYNKLNQALFHVSYLLVHTPELLSNKLQRYFSSAMEHFRRMWGRLKGYVLVFLGMEFSNSVIFWDIFFR